MGEAGTGEAEEAGSTGFGTFAGVFVPTLLTILGVILFLRLGWVVGNAGLLGAFAVIGLAFLITGATALSLSSITTNIRIGAGGAYSIISRSLGIEVGGSIGVPLYLSQALAVSMYVFGFREGWRYVFPQHPPLLVDLAIFGVLFLLAFVSANLAFKIQYVILAIIVGAIGSVVAASFIGAVPVQPITWTGAFPGAPETGFQGTDFWFVFAVFFPAATGIMAGANMSGELEDPRRAIPKGTLGAIGVSFVVYMVLAFWLARTVPVPELVSNYTSMIDNAYFAPIVLGGLLAATFSSALVSLVGAPRILQALAVHDVVPASDWFGELASNGEPRHAMLATGGIVFAALMLRDLNAVAPLITMFFLITYTMINVVILVEQRLELLSFRPLMAIPTWIPIVGAGGCLFAMFIINPLFGLVSVGLVVGLYAYLINRSLAAPYGDVRSGLFVALAEWGVRKVGELSGSQERAWKPNLLVPIDEPRRIRGSYLFLRNLAHPTGTVRLLGVAPAGESETLVEPLEDLRYAFRQDGVYATSAVLGAASYQDGVVDAVQALRGSVFRPNTLFVALEDRVARGALPTLIRSATESGMGVVVFADHPESGLGRRRRINLCIPDQGPEWTPGMDLGNIDLAILTAVQLWRTWDAEIRMVVAVDDPDLVERARGFADQLRDLARLPLSRDPIVVQDDLIAAAGDAPEGDVTIVPLPEGADAAWMDGVVEATGSACVFTRDGGEENALA